MDFGKLANIEKVAKVDFSLPPDHAMTAEVLAGLSSRTGTVPDLYVGSVQWRCRNWLGKVYPKGTKDKDFLSQYVRQFNTIELNTLFHSLQPPEVIMRWASLADPGFLFCPKFPGSISHQRQLVGAGPETLEFFEHVKFLEPKLGHSFLQLSEGFSPERAAVLGQYLRSLPSGLKACLEVRHPGWFGGSPAAGGSMRNPFDPRAEAIWRLLRELGIGAVITDTAGRRDCLHMRLTAPVAFIRFVANGHPTDHSRIDAWAGRLQNWTGKGLSRVYFFVHSPEEYYSPELCRYAVGAFNKACGTTLRPPVLYDDGAATPLTLF